MGDKDKLSGDQVAELGLDDWRPMLGVLRARFLTGDFVTGAALVAAITEAAEEANHHPDLDLRYPHLDVRLTSHDVSGTTSRDVELARTISRLAAARGIGSDTSAVQEVELGLDTWDADEIGPFWAAVLGAAYQDGEVVHPDRTAPTVWFQDTDRHDEPRQRFHLDLWVPTDEAEQRIQEALAAGGFLVSDERAPRFTVLADAQGNKVCVCTVVGRPD